MVKIKSQYLKDIKYYILNERKMIGALIMVKQLKEKKQLSFYDAF